MPEDTSIMAESWSSSRGSPSPRTESGSGRWLSMISAVFMIWPVPTTRATISRRTVAPTTTCPTIHTPSASK